MLLRYCFAYHNRKKRDIIIILKTVKFNFLMLTDTVVEVELFQKNMYVIKRPRLFLRVNPLAYRVGWK
jgi:hypothetical protein